MNIEEIKAFLESNKDQPEVQGFIGELSAVSPDKVKGFLETDEGRRLIQPDLDRYHAKSLDSWKANNLDSLVEAELSKRNPSKTPLEIEVENLKKAIEDKDKASKRLELKNKALAIASEKKLNVDERLLDRLIADDEESTLSYLDALETYTQAQYKAGVESVYKTSGRDVPGGSNDKGDSYGKKLAVELNQGPDLESARSEFFK